MPEIQEGVEAETTEDLDSEATEVEEITGNQHICPITQAIILYPVTTPSGHNFEMDAIVEWLTNNSTCPVTRNVLFIDELEPNLELLAELNAARQEAGLDALEFTEEQLAILEQVTSENLSTLARVTAGVLYEQYASNSADLLTIAREWYQNSRIKETLRELRGPIQEQKAILKQFLRNDLKEDWRQLRDEVRTSARHSREQTREQRRQIVSDVRHTAGEALRRILSRHR